ncbi:MAG: VOC family protein [Solirubrobacteraceae bacterium]|nr:VOC family protein [Solirubrobacteraceae bacterium]
MAQKIVPNLWFDGNAEEAADFYVSVFTDSRITATTRYPEGAPGPAGTVMTVSWELNGQKFTGINGGPEFQFDEAISFQIDCEDQAEVDYYWDALTADGGAESQCGWCKDKFGVSWQVVPKGMDEFFTDNDPERVGRAMHAMLGMKKLDVAAMQAAADGQPVG